MSEETEKVRAIVAGILSSVKEGEEDRNVDLAAALLSEQIEEIELSSSGTKELARLMIKKGFGNDPREFVFAFGRYYEKLRYDQESFSNKQQETVDQLMLASVAAISYNLISGIRQDTTTIEATVNIRLLISDSNYGPANQLIRLCGKMIDASIVDQYCEGHPYGYNQWDYLSNDVKEWLVEGMFRKLGFWRIWCMVRRFFLGKKPEIAEAEMEKQQRIELLQAKLEESWRYPVILNDPYLEDRRTRETECFGDLKKLDPDNAVSWFEKNAPSDRRGD